MTYEARWEAPDTDGDVVLWPDPEAGPWRLKLLWAEIAGRYECVGMELRSYRGDGEDWPMVLPHSSEGPAVLTASVLRKVPLGEVIADLRRQKVGENVEFAAAFAKPEDDIDADLLRLGQQQAAAWGGQVGAVDGHQQVAEIYLAAWNAGKNPTQAVADELVLSHSAAAKRVSRARAAGYLPPTKQGRSGLGDPR